MENTGQPQPLKAFVSCSLRPEDHAFNYLIEHILGHFDVVSFGTVGRHDARPENPAVTMRKNIEDCDFVVVVATSRYLQKDIHTGKSVGGLSEMIQVESGLAYAQNKPLVVFVQKGTNVGNFIPNITQYIELDGTDENVQSQWELIYNMFCQVFQIVNDKRQQQSNKQFWNVVKGGLAIWGGYTILNNLAGYEDDNDHYRSVQPARKRKTTSRTGKRKTYAKSYKRKY